MLDVLGWITFIASFPIGFIGFIVTIVSFFVGSAGAVILIPVLLLTPVSSIVIGILLNRRKGGRKSGVKNLVIGIATAFFLSVMLLSSMNFEGFEFEDDVNEKDQAAINEILSEAALIGDVDFSSGEYASLYDATAYGYNYKVLEVDGFEDALEIYAKAKSNPLFLSTVPNELLGLLHEYDRSGSSDLYLIYNLDTEQYNCYPAVSGEYNMISIVVDYYEESDDLYVQIIEYKLTYIKAAVSDF